MPIPPTRFIWIAAAAGFAIWSLFFLSGLGLLSLFGNLVETHGQGLSVHPSIDPWLEGAIAFTQGFGMIALTAVWVVGSILIAVVAAFARWLLIKLRGHFPEGIGARRFPD